MPVLLGAFETSLRGGDSPSVDRKILHKGCSGDLHGHGVRKERSVRELPAVARGCAHCHNNSSSSDSGESCHNCQTNVSNALLRSGRRSHGGGVRSQSSDCAETSLAGAGANGLAPLGLSSAKRSSSAVVAQRLFSSPTAATTAKLRAERTASDGKKMTMEMKKLNRSLNIPAQSGISSSLTNLPKFRLNKSLDDAEHDSGHASSDNEGWGNRHVVDLVLKTSSEDRKQSLINGTSDDETIVPMSELRRRQRKERRDYLQRHSPKTTATASRKESPSPGPKPVFRDRDRRSSDEYSESESTTSPPTTPCPPSTGGRAYSAAPSPSPSSGARRNGHAEQQPERRRRLRLRLEHQALLRRLCQSKVGANGRCFELLDGVGSRGAREGGQRLQAGGVQDQAEGAARSDQGVDAVQGGHRDGHAEEAQPGILQEPLRHDAHQDGNARGEGREAPFYLFHSAAATSI